MPFTLSHAAAVLPAIRRDGSGRGGLVPAVLVAGSFAPDMPYYAASVLSGGMRFGAVTHSLLGVFTVDVLIAGASVGSWLVLREPLVALLPRARQGRPARLLRCGAPRSRPSAALVGRWYGSAVLGALTHVAWDAFTHHDRWGMRLVPALGRSFGGSPLYSWLQYGSSLAGAAVIAAWSVSAVRRTPAADPSAGPGAGPTAEPTAEATGEPTAGPTSEPAGVVRLSARDRGLAAAVIGGCALVGAVERASRWWMYRGTSATPYELIPTLCFGAGAGLVPGLLLYAAGVRLWRPARDGGAPDAAEPEARTVR
ncbi:DUF4184 family protein [Streptomyces mangrovisoli]|uniref:DUF4184 domain-containing protein n=1 Tax=Streptomyces mangrovisoli TaxID=1428628 RepID=A0A1J4P2T1_9ACTN|nr:DUF4184 family protein [Streptomyces mangrovisoli]OIJ69065.1 hypothetical protein WN71_004590 [Streptomyces mangrovisoli]